MTYDFVSNLPDWYQTQTSLQEITDTLDRNDDENFLTDEERKEYIKRYIHHIMMLNVEPYNVLPI
jgi:hypothetical protein